MILQTKLNVPPVGHTFVSRPRLYARMDEILERKVALISAAAGYGKTTLLSAWLQRLTARQNRVVWPPQVHLIISSRCDPPFSLSSLRAKEKLVEIHAGDLCFTAEEAAQFLNDVMAPGFSQDVISLLGARTQGWIAGLQLAALIARDPLVASHRGDVSTLAAGFDKGHGG